MTECDNPYEQLDISQWPLEIEMRQLVEAGVHLSQDEVYYWLATHLSPDEIEEKVAEDYQGEQGRQMVALVKQTLGDAYIPLLVEPSVSNRAEEFVAFAVDQMQAGRIEPWELRNAFKDSLGKATVYRVASLNPEELESIPANGFIANFYRQRTMEALLENRDILNSLDIMVRGLENKVNCHIGWGSTGRSRLISVSDYPNMAQFAATAQLKDELNYLESSGRGLYMTPIEIDEFYLIRLGKHLRTSEESVTWSDGHIEIPSNDPGIEALVEFWIPPSAIKVDQIQQLDPGRIPQFQYIPPPGGDPPYEPSK
jgi:hypothetical protein